MNSRLAIRLLKLSHPRVAKPGTWPRLTRPVDADEIAAQSRAQSLLCGMKYRDGSSQAPPLTYAQAQDVLRWAKTI